jgi:hypothetical protein
VNGLQACGEETLRKNTYSSSKSVLTGLSLRRDARRWGEGGGGGGVPGSVALTCPGVVNQGESTAPP